ncbi:GGDEF domain-containing protein [Ruminococcaceae bacterium OttesenSCG-928-I18]|nr:GGDEF domain-containing protein [Ruminococcaceae bacterium OttesenSCG-928-I18]
MQINVSQWLGCPLSKEEKEGFYSEVLRTLYWPTMFVGILILLFEAVMILTTLVRPQWIAELPYRRVYFALYVFLFLVTFVFMAALLALRDRLQNHPRIFVHICQAYAFFICLWGSFLSAFSGGDTAVFTYVVMGVAVMIVLQPWQAALLLGVNQCLFYLLLYLFSQGGSLASGKVINSLIATLLAVLIASILYRNKAVNYQNTLTITQQNEKIRVINNQLRSLVLADELTGAYNRRFLEEILPEKLEDARRAGEEVAVFMMDIDRFKQYNDIYGHVQGDACLVSVADIIHRTALSEESYFVRYGGEEFVLFLQGEPLPRCRELAEKIRKNIARCRLDHTGCPTGYVTVSIGVCFSGVSDTRDIHELVHCADEAMYFAKKAGRNQVCFYEQDAGEESWEEEEISWEETNP